MVTNGEKNVEQVSHHYSNLKKILIQTYTADDTQNIAASGINKEQWTDILHNVNFNSSPPVFTMSICNVILPKFKIKNVSLNYTVTF